MAFAALDIVRGTGITKLARWLRYVWGALLRGHPPDARPIEALTLLSSGEKALLRRFREENARTIHVSNPAPAFGLELAEIVSIHRDPEREGSGEAFGLVLHAWAWDHLARHPEILGAAGGGEARFEYAEVVRTSSPVQE